jgi:hypothetical protein
VNESAPNTETRLPRQVKARADNARTLLTPNPDQPNTVNADPPAAAPVELPSPTPSPAAIDPRENDPVYWKQRFKVTEGMWKRDKERFDLDRQSLQEQLDTALTKVRELESKGSTSEDEIDLAEFFTAEEIETLGEDQARIQARTIQKQARKIAKELVDKEVQPLRKREQDKAVRLQEEAQQGFLAALTELAPNWEAVNVDERWLDWLSQDDPNTGIWRQQILDNAQAKGDAARVAKMIEQWESSLNPVAVPREPNAAPEGRSGAGGGGAPGDENQPVLGHPSKQEIRDFYKRKALGKITEAQAKEFDARIAAATRAGYL